MEKKEALPAWLYEALPYVYAVAGLMTMAVLRNLMAVFSGLALLSAGITVWTLRYRYRQSSFDSLAGFKEVDPFATSASQDELVQISWRNSIETGHPVIDSQHRRLFGMSNELIKAVLADKQQADIELMLDELLDHVAGHFQVEESILAEIGHPVLEEHRVLHHALLAQARKLMAGFQCAQVQLGELVGFMAYSLVMDHIMKDDQKFAGDVIPSKS